MRPLHRVLRAGLVLSVVSCTSPAGTAPLDETGSVMQELAAPMPAIFEPLEGELASAEDAAGRSRVRSEARQAAEELVRRDPSRYDEYLAFRAAVFDDPAAVADAQARRAELARQHGSFRPTAADVESARRLRGLLEEGGGE